MKKSRYALVALIGVSVTLLLADGVQAQGTAPPALPGQSDQGSWNALSGALLQLLAVVIVVESALAALFNWRVFRIAFNARALKTPIMFGVGLLLVLVTTYDPMNAIITAGGVPLVRAETWVLFSHGTLTAILSAMIIAGGSEGVFQLFKKLGIRAPETTADEVMAKELKNDQAWISIRAVGTTGSEPIQIGIEELNAADLETDDGMAYVYDHAGKPPLAGTIDSRTVWQRIRAAFTADVHRFPSYGGRTVAADRAYRITATWMNGDSPTSVGIFRGKFASRALIDLAVDVSKIPV